MNDNIRVELTRTPDDMWQASVNGAVIPLAGYLVEPDEDGRALVSLTVAADEVSVRRTPVAAPALVVQTAQASGTPAPRAVWGSPGRDPREDIPGWQPEKLGGQVAGNAQRASRVPEIMPGVRPIVP